MMLARMLLFLMATAFMVFGVAYAGWPDAMVKDVGIQLATPAARIDLRAVYGGAQLGIGIFLYYCLLSERTLRIGLIATLAILGGLAATRALGMIVAAEASQMMWMLLAVEAIGVPLSIVGLVGLTHHGARTR